METGTEQNESVTVLQDVLRSIDALLQWIVVESNLVSDIFQAQFKELYNDIHNRIETAIRRLETITDDGDELYRALETFGLTGPSLELKLSIGRSLSEAVLASAAVIVVPGETVRVPRIFGLSLEPLLRWVNLIIGSLSRALPMLDAVKEYKEGVELTIDKQRSAPVPDRRIFPGLR